jgi:threonine aldolase
MTGSGRRDAATLLATIPTDTQTDVYGTGGVVEDLEHEVARRLGKEAALFMITGTMAQQAVLRIHADRRNRKGVVFHPKCHLDVREERGYERLHGLVAVTCGPANQPLTSAQLAMVGEPVAALLVELPQRDLGGTLPEWNELVAQVQWARDHGAATHMDGARLWEAAPFYAATASKTIADVADLFDTVYVSFYKGLGAIGGCCVAGPSDVVAEVREWRTRQGGTVFGLWPYAASCRTSLRERLPRMAEYRRHALAIAAALADLPGARVVPDPPQTSHLHLHLQRGEQELRAAALRLARDEKIWTFARWFPCDTPSVQRIECPVGESTLTFSPAEFRRLIAYLVTDE